MCTFKYAQVVPYLTVKLNSTLDLSWMATWQYLRSVTEAGTLMGGRFPDNNISWFNLGVQFTWLKKK